MIKSNDGKKTAIALSQAVSSPGARHEGSLVFHRYGSTYFLSEVWSPGSYGRKLFPASRERELAARLATPANANIAAGH